MHRVDSWPLHTAISFKENPSNINPILEGDSRAFPICWLRPSIEESLGALSVWDREGERDYLKSYMKFTIREYFPRTLTTGSFFST